MIDAFAGTVGAWPGVAERGAQFEAGVEGFERVGFIGAIT